MVSYHSVWDVASPWLPGEQPMNTLLFQDSTLVKYFPGSFFEDRVQNYTLYPDSCPDLPGPNHLGPTLKADAWSLQCQLQSQADLSSNPTSCATSLLEKPLNT